MKTCLVVDDSKIVRTVARRILEEINFMVSEAEDGRQAMEACERQMPDAILLDWNMPVMNGLQFIDKLRRTAGGGAPKVIFCTTENDAAHIVEAISVGADEYIMKPFDSDIIRSKLAQVGLID